MALNDAAGTSLATASNSVILATFAHELGHALGLGHSSVEYSLMYYSVGGKDQDFLSEDDMKGISWLYPLDKKLAGFAGSCASISDGTDSGQFSRIFLLLFSLVIGTYFAKKKRNIGKL